MTPADLDRFRRILGMLGSEHTGERAAAALVATNFLEAHGLGWSDVSVPGGAAVPFFEAAREAWKAEQAPAEPDMMQAARESKDALRKARRARWEQNADQPDADGFHGGRK